MSWLFALAVLALAPMPAGAEPLTLVKTGTVVADPVSAINPKAIPGASVDYAITVANPGANAAAVVGAVVVTDSLPAGVKLRVADLGATGGGPVEFSDGNLLGLGLVASGLAYRFVSLASAADGVDFSTDGADWSYIPIADATGCDARVRAIRVRLTGNQAAGSGFRLRFRVMVT